MKNYSITEAAKKELMGDPNDKSFSGMASSLFSALGICWIVSIILFTLSVIFDSGINGEIHKPLPDLIKNKADMASNYIYNADSFFYTLFSKDSMFFNVMIGIMGLLTVITVISVSKPLYLKFKNKRNCLNAKQAVETLKLLAILIFLFIFLRAAIVILQPATQL